MLGWTKDKRKSVFSNIKHTAMNEDTCGVKNSNEISLLKHNQRCIVNRIS